jgi:hypothetical protein
LKVFLYCPKLPLPGSLPELLCAPWPPQQLYHPSLPLPPWPGRQHTHAASDHADGGTRASTHSRSKARVSAAGERGSVVVVPRKPPQEHRPQHRKGGRVTLGERSGSRQGLFTDESEDDEQVGVPEQMIVRQGKG